MSLKDSSVYNVQFIDGKPMLIDTLSFQLYKADKPWTAYRQYCQHFLAPLALMSMVDIRLSQLYRVYLEGIPLDLADLLLPRFLHFKLGLWLHIRLHSKIQHKYSDSSLHKETGNKKFSKKSFYGLIENLEKCIANLSWKVKEQIWDNYYSNCHMDQSSFGKKKNYLTRCISEVNPSCVWDLGANTGFFSRLASNNGIFTISLDFDISCVEKSYIESREKNEKKILPLFMDITNPSPSIGWENIERKSLKERGPVDLAVALALVHHLAISNNLPFSKIASFFHSICTWLVIEFVPKQDPMVSKLLRSREDIFQSYTKEDFEFEFSQYFQIKSNEQLPNSSRILYLMERKATIF
jgi:ribosomal protein L11 methylase PrmA